MRILAVDDEKLMLELLTYCIGQAEPEAEVVAFQKPRDALEHAKNNIVDVAFLDIQMRGLNGLELAKLLMEIHPEINIIFCTSYDEYLDEAFRRIRCNGYITKPVDTEQIRNELDHLRKPINRSQGRDRVYIRCMGRFDLFVDGQSVVFKNQKVQELLALIVHGWGGMINNEELQVALWHDEKDHTPYFKKLRKDLLTILKEYKCEDIIIQSWGSIGVDLNKFDSDMFEWKKTHPWTYPAEYMSQYAWMIY